MSIAGQPEPPLIRRFPEARHLPLDLIDPNPDQPRRQLDGIEELAAHVRKHNLLQPIIVTAAAKGRYTLIAGHRRLAAFQWLARHDDYPARWRDIPAVIRTVEGSDRLTLALAENLSRRALTDAEVASAIQVLIDLHAWSQAELARRLGVSPSWINQVTHVLAEPDLAGHVQTGRLSLSKAYQIQRATTPESRETALNAALNGAPFHTIRRLAECGEPAVPFDGETGGVAQTPKVQNKLPPPLPPPPAIFDNPQERHSGPAVSYSMTETGGTAGDETLGSATTQSAETRVAEATQNTVPLRRLATYTLFQHARRQRQPLVPTDTLTAALQSDLASLTVRPPDPHLERSSGV
jgi:ParB/RepB/Spo0J family partition protein